MNFINPINVSCDIYYISLPRPDKNNKVKTKYNKLRFKC